MTTTRRSTPTRELLETAVRRVLPVFGRGLAGALVGREAHRSSADVTAPEHTVRVIRVVALVVVVALLLTVALNAATGHGGMQLIVLVVAVVVPLVLVLRYPLWAWRWAWLCTILLPFVIDERHLDPVQLAVLLLVFLAAAIRCGSAVSWGMWALGLAAVWGWAQAQWPLALAASIVFTLAALVVETGTGWWRVRARLAEQEQRTRVAVEQRAALAERARIARELHDVIAHHLSMIAVQTSTAPYRLTTLSPEVAVEFERLNEAARAALNDARAVLGALRNDDAGQPDRSPQPTLADLPMLIDRARQAGLEVDLHLSPVDTTVGAGADQTAYRIVQEALSNAGRHAPGSAVTVVVEPRAEELVVRVRNSARTTESTPCESTNETSGGHGLDGLRQRAHAVGGTLHDGPTADGGYELCAELPIGPRS